ncbi:hypothetical protein JIQ42_07684 [Leishmania sp. Namibia]|uniref:hypothetical protein n=1 Tax=Leishmania sp. Namibia TaxID=2802991 RepID=UPI001B745E0E|nr:hypothetical protein JIQ42_07684 [Leishmania sp. Namibia]
MSSSPSLVVRLPPARFLCPPAPSADAFLLALSLSLSAAAPPSLTCLPPLSPPPHLLARVHTRADRPLRTPLSFLPSATPSPLTSHHDEADRCVPCRVERAPEADVRADVHRAPADLAPYRAGRAQGVRGCVQGDDHGRVRHRSDRAAGAERAARLGVRGGRVDAVQHVRGDHAPRCTVAPPGGGLDHGNGGEAALGDLPHPGAGHRRRRRRAVRCELEVRVRGQVDALERRGVLADEGVPRQARTGVRAVCCEALPAPEVCGELFVGRHAAAEPPVGRPDDLHLARVQSGGGGPL